jgi:hypothetical protein
MHSVAVNSLGAFLKNFSVGTDSRRPTTSPHPELRHPQLPVPLEVDHHAAGAELLQGAGGLLGGGDAHAVDLQDHVAFAQADVAGLIVGPPELPGLMEASAWIISR